MAGRGANVKVSITADNSGLERGVRGAEGDLKHLGDRGSKSLHGLRAAAITAGAAITGVAVVAIKQSVDAAIEAEKSQAKMQAQLKALGISYKAHADQIDKVIQKTSQLAGLDDEDLQDAFTNVVRSSGSVSKSLEQMGLVADLARAKHIDVAKAGEIVGKVMAGNTGVLARYGIVLKDGATKTEALGELHKKFSGQAEAYGKTTAGSMDRFKVSMENLKETAGRALLPTLAGLADKAGKFIQQMVDGKGAGGEFRDVLKGVYDRIKPIVEFFTQHPKIIAPALAAWAAYKVASSAALTATKVKLAAQFLGLVGPAKLAGVRSGAGFGTSFASTSSKYMAGEKVLGGLILSGPSAGKSFGSKFGGAAMAAIRGLGWAALGAWIIEQLDVGNWIENDVLDPLLSGPLGLNSGRTRTPDPVKVNGNTFPTSLDVRNGKQVLVVHKDLAKAYEEEDGKLRILQVANGRYGSAVDASGKKALIASGHIKKHGDSAETAGGKAKIAAGRVGDMTTKLGQATRPNWKVKVDTTEALSKIRQVTTDAINLGIRLAAIANAGSGGGGGGSAPNAGKGGGRAPTASAASLGHSGVGTFTNPFGIMGSRQHRYDVLQGRLDRIDLQERAGVIGAGTALARRGQIATLGAGGNYGPLRRNDRLELLAVKRESVQGQKERRASRNSKTRHKAYNAYSAAMTVIDEKEAAGQLTAEQAKTWRLAIIKKALDGGFGGKMTPHERRLVLADQRQVVGTPEAVDPTTFAGTSFDEAALTAAQVDTPNDTSDDKAILTGRLGIARANYDAARAAGDREGMATWGGLVLSIGQAIDGLASAVADSNAINQEQLDLMRQARDDYQRALNVSQSQYDVFKNWIAEVASGQLGGRMGLGFQTPGYAGGGMARY